MSYATNTDVEQRMGPAAYIQLTDDAGTGGAEEAKVTQARLAAEAEINSYLAVRYRVPVDVSGEAEVGALLRDMTVDLAAFRLHARRPPVASDLAARHEAVVEWLRRIAQGSAALPAASELPASTAAGAEVFVSGMTRVWSRDDAADL
jgi:phage gp36-like protein